MEDDEALEFTVTLSPVINQEATVEYETASGTARAGNDYTPAIGTLTFPAGTTEQTILVSIIDDNMEDDEETFTVDALGGLLTPYARIASGRDTHTYGVGGRLRVDLVAECRERTTAQAAHEFKLRSTLYW